MAVHVGGRGPGHLARTGGFDPDASVALDFLAGRYRVGEGSGSTSDFAGLPGLTVSRSSVGYAETQSGLLVPFASNVARITDKGLLVEESRTNLFLNSFAPVTQNVTITAASHTITVWGSGSVTVAAGTATISNGGAVTAGSPRTIGCTVAGTISVTVTGSPTVVQVEAGTFGTSPILTTGSTATRGADNISLGGLSVGTPYTLFAEVQWPSSPIASAIFVEGWNGSALSGATLSTGLTGSRVRVVQRHGANRGDATSSIDLIGGAVVKMALSADGSVSLYSTNGFTISSGAPPTQADWGGTLVLGGRGNGTATPANTYLRKLVLKLSADGQSALNALTT